MAAVNIDFEESMRSQTCTACRGHHTTAPTAACTSGSSAHSFVLPFSLLVGTKCPPTTNLDPTSSPPNSHHPHIRTQAWLDPVHLPTKAQLACAASGEPLRFLLQVYSPLDDEPSAFHRAIYVFVSPRGDKLVQRGAVRAFRCQLPKDNAYYPPVPPSEDELTPPTLSVRR